MIKNFLSKALLSVVMDKSARENLQTKQKFKKVYKDIATGAPPRCKNPHRQGMLTFRICRSPIP